MGKLDGRGSGGIWDPSALVPRDPVDREDRCAQPERDMPPQLHAEADLAPPPPVATADPSHSVAPAPGRPASSQRVSLLIGGVVMALLMAGVTVGVIRSGSADPSTGAVESHYSPVLDVPSATGPAPAAGLGSVPSSISQPRAPESPALAQLEALRERDLQTVRFTGQWVAQLASKSVGIVDPLQLASNGSHVFYAQDILAEHLALRQGDDVGAPVVLLLTTDYGERRTYQGEALWATFALGSFGSAADVRSWCSQRFPERSGDALVNACAPRQLEPTR